jgi:hypothetical protein
LIDLAHIQNLVLNKQHHSTTHAAQRYVLQLNFNKTVGACAYFQIQSSGQATSSWRHATRNRVHSNSNSSHFVHQTMDLISSSPSSSPLSLRILNVPNILPIPSPTPPQTKEVIEDLLFTPIVEVQRDTIVNVIGIIADFSPVSRPTYGRKGSFVKDVLTIEVFCRITLSDSLETLNCFFSSDNSKDLPQPMKTGQLLMLCNLRIKNFKGKIQGWSCEDTTFDFISFPFSTELNILQKNKLQHLQEWWISKTSPKKKISSRRLKYMGELPSDYISRHYDIIAEVSSYKN